MELFKPLKAKTLQSAFTQIGRLFDYMVVLLLLLPLGSARADSFSHALWLQEKPCKSGAKIVVESKKTPTMVLAVNELKSYYAGKKKVYLSYKETLPCGEYDVLRKGNLDGYTIDCSDKGVRIVGNSDRAVLYAVYDLMRNGDKTSCSMSIKNPSNAIRCLNHWDNLNGTVERGYAGHSIFWSRGAFDSPQKLKEAKKLWSEYARANASVGINAVVLDNVNANKMLLCTDTLKKVAVIADVLRPYGIRVYLAVNFASPKTLGGLSTADPLVPEVRTWWADKAKELYKLIPDFGGFLVKANSEGEPGPMDYGRTHVDGANMLAEALEPFGGLVMWRAFVYAAKGGDRASQAYNEFVPFDGQFKDNVIIQIKNGPIDFQPREPLSPLFFGLHATRMMPELQITQEYTGHNVHTCYLVPMWKESVYNAEVKSLPKFNAVAGVANIGDDDNWCGSDMAQANWYAFGRLAWDNTLSSKQIAEEWLKQTFSKEKLFVESMSKVMLASHEALVNYMMPLGLHHIFAGGHHYGPEPWCNPPGWREDWVPKFYHRADSIGIGFNRSSHVEACVKDSMGSANVEQYPEPLRSLYENVETCPEEFLLWFHHVPWTYKMKNGKTLWENLCIRYEQGIGKAEMFVKTWESVKGYVDKERYDAQLARFKRQAADAWWWRDACLLYFQTFSKLSLPADSPSPRHKLDDLMHFNLGIDNYSAPPADRLP